MYVWLNVADSCESVSHTGDRGLNYLMYVQITFQWHWPISCHIDASFPFIDASSPKSIETL